MNTHCSRLSNRLFSCMKLLKRIFIFGLIVVMLAVTVEVEGKTRRNRSRKPQVSRQQLKRGITVADVLQAYDVGFGAMASQCPIECAPGVVLKMVSFKSKCATLVMAYTSECIAGKGSNGRDDSELLDFITDRALKMLAVGYIRDMEIPIETFAKSGIHYKLTLQDDKGNVLSTKQMSNAQVVQCYKQEVASGKETGGFDLEFLKGVVRELDETTPIDFGNGIVINSVTMQDRTISYNISSNSPDVQAILISNPAIMRESIKEFLLSDMHRTLSKSGILDTMVELGITFEINIFAQIHSAPVYTFTISSSDLKKINDK